MVTFCPFSKGLLVSFLSDSFITSHATRCYLISASGNIFKWHTSLLFKYLRLKCYFVTLLPRPFLQQHKRAERIVKVRKISRISNQTTKTIRARVAHDDNNNNNRDETTVPSHFTLHFTNCNAIQWPIVTYVQVLTVKCKMQWILVFREYNMVLLI